MIESDITINVTADCQELMPTHETNMPHATDCTCDSCCCETSTSHCQDNREECEATQQHSERLNTMNKLMPVIAKCAVILAIGLSGSIKEISAAESISANTIGVSQRAEISAINRRDIVEVNRAIPEIAAVQIGAHVTIEQIGSIEIPSPQIPSTIHNVITD